MKWIFIVLIFNLLFICCTNFQSFAKVKIFLAVFSSISQILFLVYLFKLGLFGSLQQGRRHSRETQGIPVLGEGLLRRSGLMLVRLRKGLGSGGHSGLQSVERKEWAIA